MHRKSNKGLIRNFLDVFGGGSVSKLRHLILFIVVFVMIAGMYALSAFAAEAGWGSNRKETKIYYYAKSSSGKLKRVKGLYEIDGNYYYFNSSGLLQTGWISMSDGYRYFEEEGEIGEKGVMYEGGVRKIGKYYYGFDDDGKALKGFKKVGKYWYYFSKSSKLGTRGRAAISKWKNVSSTRRVYFQARGKMARNKWVQNHTYYVIDDGTMLVSDVTPDGYLVGDDGKEVRKLENGWFILDGNYYFYDETDNEIIKSKLFKYNGKYYYVDEDGVRQTGWQKIGSYTYYFYPEKGYAATGTVTIDGISYIFTKKGRYKGLSSTTNGTKTSTGKASVLILCGHGQGDSGAVGCGYYEYLKTREFGKLIYNYLLSYDTVNVDLFNTSYDMYQQLKSTLNAFSYGSGTLQAAITGKGSLKNTTLTALRTNTLLPEFIKYDYILEVHFNATIESLKDSSGNGSIKGACIYVNSYKSSSDKKIDSKILSRLKSAGMPTFGNGVYSSSGLLCARVFTEIGANYSLLETCFIDDKDDMNCYTSKKKAMARAVAKAIGNYFE